VAAKEAEIASLQTKKQSAQISLNQAKISLEQNRKYLSDSVITADMDGYVLELPLKEGEVTGAGTPVVIVKSREQVVNVGIPVDDYAKLQVGMSARLSDGNDKTDGKIEKIDLYPNETSRTYNMKIAYSGANFAIGSLITVDIPMSQKDVFLVPINAVQNIDGVDYVYYVDEDNTAKLQEVTLGDISDNNVEITGVQSGMRVVTGGIKYITENQQVSVIGE
jgi:RND family efflux transporter MFP subunit